MVAVATIPTAVIAFAFRDALESVFAQPRSVCIALLVTGVVLMLTRWRRDARRGRLRLRDALIIGVAQGVAIMPGISRSGITIAVALFLGMDRAQAARFSFLLSIPAIVGAAIVDKNGN